MGKVGDSLRKEILARIDGINVWKKGGQRAPHKPLLLLYALARLSRNDQGPISYHDIDKDVGHLLVEFGPPRKSVHPEYPFWRLQRDGLWVVHDAENLDRRRNKDDPKKSQLLKFDIKGEIPPDIARALRKDPSLFGEVVSRILDNHFPATVHDDILAEIGMQELEIVVRRRRDPRFRQQVLLAYEYRCAVCGFDIHLARQPVALEAAHIKWHQAGGPDSVNNGLALCATHHKLFDRGVFALSQDLKLSISPLAVGRTGLAHCLTPFMGRPIMSARNAEDRPRGDYLNWHWREVFREGFS